MSDATPSHPEATDRNLLFGVLALQADLIDDTQFIEGCAVWAARKDTPLAWTTRSNTPPPQGCGI